MAKMRIVINCGPCEAYIGLCLESVKAQTYSDWHAYVTIDPCGDDTYGQALRCRQGEARITIERNAARQYPLRNVINAINRSGAGPEDVIVILDGDDWFRTDEALGIIANTYQRFDCWMTYGSWLSNMVGRNGRRDGLWPAYPEGTTDFRNTRWLATAVRTWKRWLWDRIDDRDLRDDTGEYFHVSEDQVIMLPLLEMSGTARAKHIAEALMVYNKATPYSTGLTMAEEIGRNARLLERRPPYGRLESVAGRLC